MAVGFPTNKIDVDAKAGQVSLIIRDNFEQIKNLQAWLAATPDATLTGMGYTAAEVATLKSAIGDLDQLRTIYEGTATLAVAKNFRTFAKQLTGLA